MSGRPRGPLVQDLWRRALPFAASGVPRPASGALARSVLALYYQPARPSARCRNQNRNMRPPKNIFLSSFQPGGAAPVTRSNRARIGAGSMPGRAFRNAVHEDRARRIDLLDLRKAATAIGFTGAGRACGKRKAQLTPDMVSTAPTLGGHLRWRIGDSDTRHCRIWLTRSGRATRSRPRLRGAASHAAGSGCGDAAVKCRVIWRPC